MSLDTQIEKKNKRAKNQCSLAINPQELGCVIVALSASPNSLFINLLSPHEGYA